MNPFMPRRAVLRTALGLGAGLVLRPARACEYFASTLRVLHPWTRATAAGAGSAVVCMKFDEVSLADRLVGVATPVAARAEMGGPQAGMPVDVPIPAGQETWLHEGGAHVRLVGLKFPLDVGRAYPLQLVFERGGVIEATLNVDYQRFS